ncbi:hypothetical protein [Bacteroides eggerthii]|uniref:hypothetical protein n=1 Tax=Bacteroides eggerthii TaxID=28111 RepID=UPI0022E68E19|nr:hypothetical protein [Bacteroides eggerthii]
MKLILGILGLLMTTANYAQEVYGNSIDASDILGDRGGRTPPPTSVDGTNYAKGSDNPRMNLAHWGNALGIGKRIDIETSDSFSDNWLDAANTCTNRGWRLPTVADFWLVSMLKKELEEQNPYSFTPFLRGKARELPSNPGDRGWHYWLATEFQSVGQYSYMMVFDDDGDEMVVNATLGYYGVSGKAGIKKETYDPPFQMPFRCVRDHN